MPNQSQPRSRTPLSIPFIPTTANSRDQTPTLGRPVTIDLIISMGNVYTLRDEKTWQFAWQSIPTFFEADDQIREPYDDDRIIANGETTEANLDIWTTRGDTNSGWRKRSAALQ